MGAVRLLKEFKLFAFLGIELVVAAVSNLKGLFEFGNSGQIASEVR
jgi:hypothetical protein